MSRLDRLELVVRNLADRVLGEKYTFDAIAEQEAAEQGVAFVPPVEVPAPQPGLDLSPILEAIENLSQRVAAVEQRDFLAMKAEIDGALSALAGHMMQQEAVIQEIIQALSGGGGDYGRVINGILEKTLIPKDDKGMRRAG